MDPRRRRARRQIVLDDPHSIWPWHHQTFTIEDDTRQLLIRPSRPLKLEFGGQEITLGPTKGLWILAEDAICRSVMELDYQFDLEIRGSFFRRHYEGSLKLEVKDWVDNAAGIEIPLHSRR